MSGSTTDRMQQHVHLTNGRGCTHIWRDHAFADGRCSPTDGGTPCRDSASATSLGSAPTIPGWPITFIAARCVEARRTLRAHHGSARPDAGRIPAAYTGLCIGDICPAQTWLDDRWNFRPARARGSALQRSQLAQMIAWSSNTHTAGIHMVAATTSAHSRWMAAYLTKRGGMRG